MDMPGRICGFLRRHRRKFIFAGVLVGGVVGTVKYAQYKIKDWMVQEEKRYLEELRKQQHFEKTQEHCFAIAQAVANTLKDNILQQIDTEAILDSLKTEVSAERKLELWNELKVVVFAKVSISIYILTLSIVIIRLQLNHLAAKVYASTLTDQSPPINDVIQRWFLSISHEFVLDNGLECIIKEFTKISQDLTESMPLQCRVRGADIESVLKSIHNQIRQHGSFSFHVKSSENDSNNILDLLLPNEANVNFGASVDLDLQRQLINEMWDIFDSNDCMQVFESCIFKSFKNFAKIDGSIIDSLGTHSKALVSDITPIIRTNSDFLPLAKVLPMLNSHVHAISHENFIRKVLTNPMLTKFSANIYQSFTDTISC
uniref:LOW QUALITY PROTEIN: peroxisomal biogenesis factor 3-like n=1 Tax=Styela clava TaxID=7725 RepID=UPI0019394881|nr:LOW QUALITY PROTEIN: peroxisomal biogenesis factor 3-like [Styela clava]